MHLSDGDWEAFIEDACHGRIIDGRRYARVKKMGGAGDRGRDVEARFTDHLQEFDWDLYQGKHYSTPLAPSHFFPELAKFFENLSANAYPTPRAYFLCSPRNSGPELHDLLAAPARLKSTFLAAWDAETTGLKGMKVRLTQQVKQLIANFDFSRIRECLVRDLIGWHALDRKKHFAMFGIEPDRGTDPEIPDQPGVNELRYVSELVRVYSEHKNHQQTLAEIQASEAYGTHFADARASFYCAEGLRRFSRDLYTDDEFGHLLEMVRLGIAPRLSSPKLTNGMDRLDKAMEIVSSIKVSDSPLNAQLRGGDLPGTCHHLVNEDRLKWVR